MWDMSSCDYELWRERDYEIPIMRPILETVLRFQIFTVLIMIVSTERRRMTGNGTDSLQCTESDTRICFLQLNNSTVVLSLWCLLCISLMDVCLRLGVGSFANRPFLIQCSDTFLQYCLCRHFFRIYCTLQMLQCTVYNKFRNSSRVW